MKPIPQSCNGIFLSGRTFDDYRAMFLLSDEEIRNARILDCPGGTSDFGLVVRERGGDAVSADPLYNLGAEELRRRITLDRQAMSRYARENRCLYADGAESAFASWKTSQNAFLEDYERDAARELRHYRRAALPSLPFPDDHFDIVVSAFLLFVYDTTFDVEFHCRALTELARVSSGTVRVHPVGDEHGRPYPHLGQLEAALPQFAFEFTAVSGVYRSRPQMTLTLKRV